jgi:hypothetical protein
MRFRCLLSLMVISAFPALAAGGMYSSVATPAPKVAGMVDGLPSPDGHNRLHLRENESTGSSWSFKAWVTRDGKRYSLPYGTYVNAEVAWSPDSRAFFLTYSDGGNVGTYHVLIYRLDGGGIRRTEPIPNGRSLFKPICFDAENPNVGAIRWGNDSRTLVIAVEVPPHSSCASMGTFRAFEITLPDAKVLKTYNQLEAKELFRESLGLELAASDDDCVKRPETCVPAGLEFPPSKLKAE